MTITTAEAATRKGVAALHRGDLAAAESASEDLGRALFLQNFLSRVATLGEE